MSEEWIDVTDFRSNYPTYINVGEGEPQVTHDPWKHDKPPVSNFRIPEEKPVDPNPPMQYEELEDN